MQPNSHVHESERLLGVGIYAIPEAARLTGIPPQRIRRWVKGYSFRVGDEYHESPPVFRSQLPPMDGTIALGFRDLIEVRFVDAFLRRGVSWRTIRRAAEYACHIMQTSHPFSTKRFKTDGRRILGDFVERGGRRVLLDLVDRQYEIYKIVLPTLYEGIEFSGDEPTEWWPRGHRGRVVLDPERSFGEPIVAKEGVPTRILARAYHAEDQDLERVARWFEVERASVRAAVDYEADLARAA